MSTVSERKSGPREMSFRGFAVRTLHAVTAAASSSSSLSGKLYTLQSPVYRNQSGGREGKTPTGNSTGFMWNLCLEVYRVWMSIWKSPTETHVHCLVEEATRFMFTKLKYSNTQHIDLKKHMGQRLGKHSLWFFFFFFCQRMTGVSVTMVSLWKPLIGWLLLPQNNKMASWSLKALVRC